MGRKGGQATASKLGRRHMQKIGRKGFHAVVAKHFGGDYRLALNTLIARGLMAQDPVPENRAWTKTWIPNRLYSNWVPPVAD
jgi:hypothetical protein